MDNATPVDFSFANDYNAEAIPVNTIVLHKDFKVADLQQMQEHRRRFTGNFGTNNPESFFKYVKERAAEEGAQLDRTFIMAEEPQSRLYALSILNFGETSLPGHADDRAILNLIKDPLFGKFMLDTAGFEEATDFAETLEAFLGAENISGWNNGEEINFAVAVKAIRNAKIDKQATSNLNTTGLQYEASDFEKIAIASAETNLADTFTFTTPLYLNLEPQTVTFAVDVKFQTKDNGGQKALYRLRPLGLINHYLKAAENFQTLVSEQLDNVLIGNFNV